MKIKGSILLLALGVSALLPGLLYADEETPTSETMVWYNDWDGQIYTDYEEYLRASTIHTPMGEIYITKEKFVGLTGLLGVALTTIIVGGIIRSIL